jgi:hypothetical protein
MKKRLASARLTLLTHSLVITDHAEYGLVETPQGLRLAVWMPADARAIKKFRGETSEFDGGTLLIGELSHANAVSLRSRLEWLCPTLLGLKTSAGLGDRIGIATPGHVRAVRDMNGSIAPIFAQQSIREMKRTGRSPQQVLDDATWGIFEEGWHAGAGADADHLKTNQDIDACFAAGFSFFTFDPGEYVDATAQLAYKKTLEEKLNGIPEYLQPSATGLVGMTLEVEGHRIHLSKEAIVRAAVKYGRAIDQIVDMYEHLKYVAGYLPFEVEISMDETDSPTTPAEHVYIASELKRMGVGWVSFAPRFVGQFEKGVEYIGDLLAFRADIAVHAAIARRFGPYKLSLHSGSDKFSLYPLFVEATHGLAHLKTAGTSYLEALRTIAAIDLEFFREIYAFAREHFESDRLSYHLSADLSRTPKPTDIQDASSLFEQFDTRQVLHVTFGSVLSAKNGDGSPRFYDRLMKILRQNREAYFGNLETHFRRHLEPFRYIE